MNYWYALVGVAVCGGLNTFAIAYGYKGVSRDEARKRTKEAVLMILILGTIVGLLR